MNSTNRKKGFVVYPRRVAAWLLAILLLTLSAHFLRPWALTTVRVLAGLYLVADLVTCALQQRWDEREEQLERVDSE